MSKKDKLLKRFLESPIRRDLSFSELEHLLTALGYKKIEGTGSAVKFYHPRKDDMINLHKPHPGNILKVYLVKQIQVKLKGNTNA
ncbi:MAG: type II toxin-antitoxin system HicA family toxin [Gammaproteobacteria bacterium]|nr:MAG: type II toxin-antitoxin system HicA family toxin [Gammaproteobacteria bacterium]